MRKDMIETALEQLGCATDAVYYHNPRGFANESEMWPIPNEFRAQADEIVAKRAAMGAHYVKLISIDEINDTQAAKIHAWNSPREDGASLIRDAWAQMTD